MWYFQYKIEIYIEDDANPPHLKPVFRSGIVPGNTFVEAVAALTRYYGEEELGYICCLKPITEDVFEFEEASAEPLFDYRIIPKKEGETEG